ncbi:MAG: ATP-dependent DNA helicase [Actinomycetota bacterium]|nr:ATP-dependent DNA helicase [Actinomycetota bacterium]
MTAETAPSHSADEDTSPRAERSGPVALLQAAVAALGGQHRPGQVEMTKAVDHALAAGEHLLVQAGTGTGKSLGYLVPALLHDERVVIATATLALQHQLVERDIPALLDATEQVLGERPAYSVLKGRGNYACLHRVREGVPDDQGALVEMPAGTVGGEVVELREWAEEQARAQEPGDRDHAPRHGDRAWQQVSVGHRDCLGASRCPYGAECFAERARERAMGSSLVVTNHSLLAIDAIDGVPMIPEYDVVVVDEAHELAGRVTQAATGELSPAMVERAARRARNFVDGPEADDLADAGDALRAAIDELPPGRIERLGTALGDALALVRDTARTCWSAFPKEPAGDSDGDAARQQARGLTDEVRKLGERMAMASERDVIWVSERDQSRGGNDLRIAPIDVALPLRDRLLSEKTVVFTSATLKLGGDFDALARTLGLKDLERVDHSVDTGHAGRPLRAGADGDAVVGGGADGARDSAEEGGADGDVPVALPWRAVDVGSPFDYRKQAILYVAADLPTPGRDGLGEPQLDEICTLVQAAGGRALGLFSSRRAAEAAAAAARERLRHLTVLCQGEAQLAELRRLFVEDPHACLFGTLSLWQGIDVPGETCQLVLIDRIPFPRPDDPLMSARSRAVTKAGGNGFMAVSATHAALLLAQGTGRLIRRTTDRGVVAILDPRLVTARYGGFLRASLAPMWATTDREVVTAALERLDAASR